MKKRIFIITFVFLFVFLGLLLGPLVWNDVQPKDPAPAPSTFVTTNPSASPEGHTVPSQAQNDAPQTGKAHAGSGSDALSQAEAVLYGKVVLREDGRPVNDAKVFLLPYPKALTPPMARVETNAQGQFAFKGPLKGAYLIYSSKGALLSFHDWESMERVVFGDEDRQKGPIVLELAKGQGIRLRVLSQAGDRPIQGAKILARGQLRLNFFTKDDGTALVSLSPGVWSLVTSAPGYKQDMQALDLSGFQPEEVVVRLHPAGLVQGVVSDQDDQVLEHVRVMCMSGGEEYETQTDSEGRYFFDQVPLEQPFTLFFSRNDCHDAYLNWQRFGLGKTEKVVDVRMRYQGKSQGQEPNDMQISGQVRSSGIGPLYGVQVHFGVPGDSKLNTATTDADGFYQMTVPDHYRPAMLTVKEKGYVYQTKRIPFANSGTVVEDFDLVPAKPIAGTVSDPTGRPLAGVALSFAFSDDVRTSPNEMDILFEEVVYSQPDGNFVFEDGPVGRVELTAWQWGFVKTHKILEGRALTQQPVAIVLQPMGVLKGVVVDENGAGIPQFRLKVDWQSDRFERPGDGLHIDPVWRSEGVQVWSQNGAFQIGSIAPDVPLKLTVNAPGFAPQHILGLVASMTSDAEPVTIQLLDRGRLLRGSLKDLTGQPLANKRVEAISYDPQDRWNSYFSWNQFFRGQYLRRAIGSQVVLTDNSGNFEIQGMPQGRIEMLINDHQLALEHVKESQLGNLEAIELFAREGKILEILVDRQTYTTAKRLDITQKRNNDFSIPLLLDDLESTFQVRQLPGGHYQVKLTGWTDPTQRRELKTIDVLLDSPQTTIHF